MSHCVSICLAAVSLLALAAGAQVAKPEIIAHRGASFDAPENTVAAFQLAWKQNADGIEGDFRLTRDGKLVCSHDPTTKRCGDKNLEIAKSTFDELRQVDVGAKKGAAWKGTRIPSIEEVLATVPQGKKIYIEAKDPQVVPALKQAIERSSLRPEQIIVISFDRKAVAAAKESFAKVKAYWLVNSVPSADETLAALKEIRADGVNCKADDRIDAELVKKVHDAGFEFHVWTVDDPAKAKRLMACGVNSITTNRPGWLREQTAGEAATGKAAEPAGSH
jgi:glycerophosphoryl diester phosphodiesterase